MASEQENKRRKKLGYHYYINKDGEIYTGRPRDAWGAHVESHNHNSIGICFEGDFNKERMDDKQMENAVLLITVLSLAYNNAVIRGHRNFNREETCPSNNFPMKELLERVKAQKKRFIRLYGEPKEVDYKFLLKNLD